MYGLRKSVFLLYISVIFLPINSSAQDFESSLSIGLPKETQITKLGTNIYLNGIPTSMIGIAVPLSIKKLSNIIGDRWSADGWRVTLEKRTDLIMVIAITEDFQKVASLTSTGENSTEGSISLTDIPRRLRTGKGEMVAVGGHLIKPVNSMVLNEVKITDLTGESITTTLTNQFNVEQNSAFYEERMVELGWKMKRKKTIEEGKSVILELIRKNQEASFTFVRASKQTFITVVWINH